MTVAIVTATVTKAQVECPWDQTASACALLRSGDDDPSSRQGSEPREFDIERPVYLLRPAPGGSRPASHGSWGGTWHHSAWMTVGPVHRACRRGGVPQWSTRSIPGASRMATPTGWAISGASGTASTTSPGSGVDAIWLSPIFRSPMADFGYDVGRLLRHRPDLRRPGRLRPARRRLPRPGHQGGARLGAEPHVRSSTRGSSRADRAGTTRSADWYVWRDLGPDGAPPNNWRAAFAVDEPAWTVDPTTGQAYLHCFLPEQPDLNWDHPEVEAAMLDTLRFWLDRGVDGFRMDVVHLHRQGPATRTTPREPPATTCRTTTSPATHERLRRIRLLLDSYPGDRTSVGEVYLLDEAAMATYYGQDDELHLSFNFPFLWASWDAAAAAAPDRPHARAPDPAPGLADVGAVEPRRAPSPPALRRLGGNCPASRGAAAHPPRNAVHVPGRGTRPDRRRRARRPDRRPRRA